MKTDKTLENRRRSPSARVTSRDVAALANVSQSTVSRVLNPGSDITMISDETAERVRTAAEELGYSPNPIARALRGERTNMIGLIVREITDPFFAGLIQILNLEARTNQLNVVLGYARSDPGEGLQMARVLDSRQVDGVIFLGDLREDQDYLQSYIKENHPLVALCRGRKIPGLPTINCNNKLGIQILMNYLRELGHCKIAYIDGGWFGDVLERREEFLRISREDPECSHFKWIKASDDDFGGGYQVIEELLALEPQPTAVIGSSDTLAVGLIKAAHDKGMKIPDDISVVGFDDITIARFIEPSLTTIRQPIEDMGKKAIEILIKRIEGETLSDEESFIEMPPKLVIRKSARSIL